MTDAQWGLIATAGVAIAGIVGQAVMARQRQQHERRMAQDERDQRRREQLYVDILTELHRSIGSLSMTEYAGLSGPKADELRARALAYASPEVQLLFATVIEHIEDHNSAVADHRVEAGLDPHPEPVFAWATPHESASLNAQSAADRVLVDLAQQISQELSPEW